MFGHKRLYDRKRYYESISVATMLLESIIEYTPKLYECKVFRCSLQL